jgi:uncharacterized membrane protein
MTWSAQSPAANWAQLRDQWWQWHIVRTIAAVTAFALVVLAALLPSKAHAPIDAA